MATLQLDMPHHVTAGTVGPPGQRTFHLQLEDADHRVTMIAEKGQVASLGEMVARVLTRFEHAPATDWDRAAMALREPLDPAWRVGEIQLGADMQAQRVDLRFIGFRVDDDAPFDTVQTSIDLDLARRLTAHIDELVDQGRPRCPLCGRPMQVDGNHVCPSTNGHGTLTV